MGGKIKEEPFVCLCIEWLLPVRVIPCLLGIQKNKSTNRRGHHVKSNGSKDEIQPGRSGSIDPIIDLCGSVFQKESAENTKKRKCAKRYSIFPLKRRPLPTWYKRYEGIGEGFFTAVEANKRKSHHYLIGSMFYRRIS